MHVRIAIFFFPRFKNRDTGGNRGADFQKFLQPRNFADPRKTVIPALGKERALVNKHSLSLWFNDMKRHLDKVDVSLLLSPDRLYNADETGFSLCPKGKKVIAFKGDKHVYTMSANTEQNITVVVCTSANGRFLHPTHDDFSLQEIAHFQLS